MKVFTKESNGEIKEFENVGDFRHYRSLYNLTECDFDVVVTGVGELSRLRKESDYILSMFAGCFN